MTIKKKLEMGLKAPLLRKDNFAEKVYHVKKDVLVLLFTSQFSENSPKNHNHKFAQVAIKLRDKFDRVGVHSVKFYAFDLNIEQGFAELGIWNDIEQCPQFLYFRANHKGTKNVLKFYGKLLTRDVAKFVHREADIKFKFTDRLHMDYI